MRMLKMTVKSGGGTGVSALASAWKEKGSA